MKHNSICVILQEMLNKIKLISEKNRNLPNRLTESESIERDKATVFFKGL
jgi:hypothetical protein